jgi:hypothetical protein
MFLILVQLPDQVVAHNPLSFLNLSQASFNVLNTDPLIIFCSVVADCGIYAPKLACTNKKILLSITYLVRMNLGDRLHVHYLDLIWHD